MEYTTPGSKALKLALGLGIPILLVVIIVAVYLFIRNRRLSKELQIEVFQPKSFCIYTFWKIFRLSIIFVYTLILVLNFHLENFVYILFCWKMFRLSIIFCKLIFIRRCTMYQRHLLSRQYGALDRRNIPVYWWMMLRKKMMNLMIPLILHRW